MPQFLQDFLARPLTGPEALTIIVIVIAFPFVMSAWLHRKRGGLMKFAYRDGEVTKVLQRITEASDKTQVAITEEWWRNGGLVYHKITGGPDDGMVTKFPEHAAPMAPMAPLPLVSSGNLFNPKANVHAQWEEAKKNWPGGWPPTEDQIGEEFHAKTGLPRDWPMEHLRQIDKMPEDSK
jgi:hypothetical protein